jgi:large subunit ribosomal protein L5
MRLKEKYQKTIVPEMAKELGFKNAQLAPRLLKAVINVSFGKHLKEKDFLVGVEKGLAKISGQKPVFTKAKKSISAFKIREGLVIGAKVTLRGNKMYDFIEKLVGITFPRVRDFRGISDKSVDRNGNLTIGMKDCTSFPEIHVEDIENTFGLEICLASTAVDRKAGLVLFQSLGFPFKKDIK